jgi:hypothetical protein
LRRKHRLAGEETIELSTEGILFGRGCIDRVQYDTLGNITLWLQRLARELGPRGIGVRGLWAVIAGALVGTPSVVVPTGVGDGADQARSVLGCMLVRLDGSRELVIALAQGRTPMSSDMCSSSAPYSASLSGARSSATRMTAPTRG